DPPVYEGPFLRGVAQIKTLSTALQVFSKGLESATREVEAIKKTNAKAKKARRAERDIRDPLEVAYEEEDEQERLIWAEQRAKFAADQLSNGSPYLFSLGTIRLWGILEAEVDDSVAELIRTREAVRKRPPFEKLTVPFQDYSEAPIEEQSAIVCRALKDSVGAAKKSGVKRFEVLLEPVGLVGPYDKDIQRTVSEMSAFRHVLVHRDGIVDARMLLQCPWLNLTKGDRIVVDSRKFHRFAQSAEWLLLEYRRRLREFDREPVETDHVSTQSILAALVADVLPREKKWPPKATPT